MIIQKGEIIYNKIEQGLFNILGDFLLQSMQEYDKFSSSKFIMSHESWGPMKMQERRLLQGKLGH